MIYGDEDFRFDSVWIGEEMGTRLRCSHCPTGMSVERVIGFEDETRHRRDLRATLSRRLAELYSPSDFVIHHMSCGSHGAAVRLSHLPSGVAVERAIGFEPPNRSRREMVEELWRRIRESEDARGAHGGNRTHTPLTG